MSQLLKMGGFNIRQGGGGSILVNIVQIQLKHEFAGSRSVPSPQALKSQVFTKT